MAGRKIKGITIEIAGDTTELSKALKAPETEISSLSKELREIDKALKFDPGNMELLGQKADISANEISALNNKLKILKDSQSQVEQQFKSGDLGEEQYRAFQREVIKTEDQIKKLAKSASLIDTEFKRAAADAGKSMQELGGKIEAAGRSIAKFSAAAVAAIAGIAKISSDYEEAVNKVEVAFGGASQAVLDFSKTTLDSFGIASVTALDMAGTFGNMATSMGISNNKAVEMSTTLVGLAGDLASLNNIRLDVSQTALNAIFTGETESLKRLGIVMTQTNLNQFAMREGYGKTVDKMKQAEQVQLRYAYVLKMTKNAQGDYANNQDSLAVSTQTLQQSVLELAVSFKDEILPVITPIVQKATELVKWFSNLDSGTKKIIVTILLLVAVLSPMLIAIGAIINSMGALLITLPKIVAAMKGWEIATKLQTVATGAATAAQWLWNAAMSANPISLIIIAIVALIAILVILYKNVESFRDGVNKIFDAIGSFVEGFVSAMAQNVKNFSKLISDLVNSASGIFTGTFKTALNGFRNLWMDMWSSIKQGPEQFISFLKKLPDRVMQIGKDIVLGLWKGIKDAWNNFKENVKNLFTGIVDGIKGMLGIHSPSTVFAGIGKNMAAGLSAGWDKEIKNVQGELNASVTAISGVRQSAQIAQTGSTGTTIGSQTSFTQVTVTGLAELQEYLDFRDNQRRRGRALNGEG